MEFEVTYSMDFINFIFLITITMYLLVKIDRISVNIGLTKWVKTKAHSLWSFIFHYKWVIIFPVFSYFLLIVASEIDLDRSTERILINILLRTITFVEDVLIILGVYSVYKYFSKFYCKEDKKERN
jgi:hypothetical protein